MIMSSISVRLLPQPPQSVAKKTRLFLQSTSRIRRRRISSWTRIEIPSLIINREEEGEAQNAVSRPPPPPPPPPTTTTTTTLEIQEQLTTPPGGAISAVDTTGRRIWPTAMPLLEAILRKVQIQEQHQQNATLQLPASSSSSSSSSAKFNNKPTVLELGAGCGLVGMGLAISNRFRHVILTDTTTDWLERNVAQNQNQLLSDGSTSTTTCLVDVLPLHWGSQRDHDSLRTKITRMAYPSSSPGDPSSSDRRPDEESSSSSSSSSPSFPSFDYIVGSDLLYNPSSHQALLSTLDEFSSSSQDPEDTGDGAMVRTPRTSTSTTTSILLAYPKRADNEASFAKLAKQKGFDVETSPLPGVLRSAQNLTQHQDRNQEYSLMTLFKLR